MTASSGFRTARRRDGGALGAEFPGRREASCARDVVLA
jgi:hypothetical protein